jgi:hypothetical protein
MDTITSAVDNASNQRQIFNVQTALEIATLVQKQHPNRETAGTMNAYACDKIRHLLNPKEVKLFKEGKLVIDRAFQQRLAARLTKSKWDQRHTDETPRQRQKRLSQQRQARKKNALAHRQQFKRMQQRARFTPEQAAQVKVIYSDRLTKFSEELDRLAKLCGLIKRKRKIRPDFLFYASIHAQNDQNATFQAIVNRYNRIVPEENQANYANLYRFCSRPEMEIFLLASNLLIFHLCPVPQSESVVNSHFARYNDICVLDGTSLMVNPTLKNQFPGVSSPAALKLSSSFSLKQGCFNHIIVCPQKQADADAVPLHAPKNTLFLADRAYPSVWLMNYLNASKSFYLFRCSNVWNPKIIKQYNHHKPNEFQGLGLRQVENKLKKNKLYDFKVTSRPNGEQLVTRLCMKYNRQTQSWFKVFTNIPVKYSSAKQLIEEYRCRWQIELAGFRDLKQHCGLKKYATGNKNLVKNLALMPVLHHTFVTQLGNCAQATMQKGELSQYKIKQECKRPIEDICAAMISREDLSEVLDAAIAHTVEYCQRSVKTANDLTTKEKQGLFPPGSQLPSKCAA